jgi:hypothetical protein
VPSHFLSARYFVLVVTLAVSFLRSHAASAEVTPATLVLAKAAIENLKTVDVISSAILKGVLDGSSDSKSVQDKEKKYTLEGMKKAAPGIVARLAKLEAAKYNLKQMGDIVEVSTLPTFQKMMSAIANGQTPPSEADMSAAEKAVLNRIGDNEYVVNFMGEIIKFGAQDKEVKSVLTSALKKALQ